MELKSRQYETSLRTFARSNRTFMELKLQKYKEIQLANDVLIVPLWN